MEPAGSGAEAAVLPEYPGGGSGYEGLPLPLPAQAEAGEAGLPATAAAAAAATAATAAEEEGELASTNYEHEEEESPNYDEEEGAGEEDEEEGPLSLAYGNLSRDNILPLARDNMDRTVGLVRDWIEQKPPQAEGKQ